MSICEVTAVCASNMFLLCNVMAFPVHELKPSLQITKSLSLLTATCSFSREHW